MNVPNSNVQDEIPESARGNPVYEQTRQDMPCWCCGRNCGRNARLVVIVLGLIGIACSTFAILSANYFSFVSLRNDTFTMPEKAQPEPFEYATEANVGLFKYEITEVFVYPWPPLNQQGGVRERDLQLGVADTMAPTITPPLPPPGVPLPGPGSQGGSSVPTETPSAFPTMQNPNDKIDVELNKVMKYEDGMDQFDSMFRNAQLGAFLAPIFAGLGTIFGLIELLCCKYKCSWLPTALFLYLAFMFQSFTLFLFLSEDFCKYDQDCKLGFAGFCSVFAIICYMICQSLICCTPRPEPRYNLCKKAPEKKKKKKKKKKKHRVPPPADVDAEEQSALNPDYDPDDDAFMDEPIGSGSDEDDDEYEDDDDEYGYRDDDGDYYDDKDEEEYGDDKYGGDDYAPSQ